MPTLTFNQQAYRMASPPNKPRKGDAMGTLEEDILSALRDGPMAFDDLKAQLDVTNEELREALDNLRDTGAIEYLRANQYRWSLA